MRHGVHRPPTADVGLHGVELRDARQRVGRDWRRSASGLLEQVTTDVRPAEGELHVTGACELAAARIAIDLRRAARTGEMFEWLLSLSVGRMAVGDRRRVIAAPWPVIAGVAATLVPAASPDDTDEDLLFSRTRPPADKDREG